jgi:hypothetical protein
MILAVIIPPSVLGKLLEECVRLLAEAVLGKVNYIFGDPPDAVQLLLAQNPADHILISANAPNIGTVQFLIDNHIPTIALIDDPKAVVGFIKTTYEADFLSYIRTASACMGAVHDLFADRAELVLDRRILDMRIADFIEELASYYGLPKGRHLEEVQQNLIRQALPRGGDLLRHLFETRAAQIDTRLTSFEAGLVDYALGPFTSLVGYTPIAKVTWPGALFSPPGGESDYSKVVDLTGEARIFIYGPGLHLPRGRWIATASFNIANNESGNTLAVDVFNGKVLAVGKCTLPALGAYSCGIPFEITEPQSAIEVRFSTAEGAIEGTFTLREVVAERA